MSKLWKICVRAAEGCRSRARVVFGRLGVPGADELEAWDATLPVCERERENVCVCVCVCVCVDKRYMVSICKL